MLTGLREQIDSLISYCYTKMTNDIYSTLDIDGNNTYE